jgi:hypothetical protein
MMENLCVACGQPIDYCTGHGVIGDPRGAAILEAHDDGRHNGCDARACWDARPRYVGMIYMGAGYSNPEPETGAYTWNTLEGVRHSVDSVIRGRGVDASVAEWNDDDDDAPARAGHVDDSSTPCADDVRVLVFANVPGVLDAMRCEGAYAAEYVVHVGPRGGIRVTRDVVGVLS